MPKLVSDHHPFRFRQSFVNSPLLLAWGEPEAVGECSATCGAGMQTMAPQCQFAGRPVEASLCEGGEGAEETHVECNAGSCPEQGAAGMYKFGACAERVGQD